MWQEYLTDMKVCFAILEVQIHHAYIYTAKRADYVFVSLDPE